MEDFLLELKAIDNDDVLIDFCRRQILHGTPSVFREKEDSYYEFRKRIANKFDIHFHDIFITGSAKLGFSYWKRKSFDLDSDVDVALISTKLYDEIMSSIHVYQIELRENRKKVSEREIGMYHEFLEYGAMGWMRPDKLPSSFQVKDLKKNWFKFFDSISHGRSEVGNYKVNAGAFKSYSHLESYTLSGLRAIKAGLHVGAINASTN